MTDPLFAANQAQNMAERAGNEKLAFVLTGLSIVFVAAMAADQCFALGERLPPAGDPASAGERVADEFVLGRVYAVVFIPSAAIRCFLHAHGQRTSNYPCFQATGGLMVS